MEALWRLRYLLEPASLALIATAVTVVVAGAYRALTHSRESEKSLDLSESSITLDTSQALAIPLASSVSLMLMFYLFSALSHLITAFTAVASAFSLVFSLLPYASRILLHLGYADTFATRAYCGVTSRAQVGLSLLSVTLVAAWLVTGHWVLNNLLGIAICIAFVSHVRLPNIRVCALLLSCLFLYDVFWVFFSERFFGVNVMVSVASQQAYNPVHTVASHLHLPIHPAVAKKLDLPVKLLFPRNLLGPRSNGECMMLGLGDMVIVFPPPGLLAREPGTNPSPFPPCPCPFQAVPGMLLALVLAFDQQRPLHEHGRRGGSYLRHAACGYAVGLVLALAAGLLTSAPQPALFYLVPTTLGPVLVLAYIRKEVGELWNGPCTLGDKYKMPET